jgi:exonuclease III
MALMDWLLRQNPDFLVITEWRSNLSGDKSVKMLQQANFVTDCVGGEDVKKNGLLIAAKESLEYERITPEHAQAGELALVSYQSLRICAAYFPQLNQKKAFFDKCIEVAERNYAKPFLIVGDLNTGRNEDDLEMGATPFACEERFISLETKAGLTDLWRSQHGFAAREWSWRSNKNGFRIDHAFANAAFQQDNNEIDCYYCHEPRETNISDHSALVIEWA